MEVKSTNKEEKEDGWDEKMSPTETHPLSFSSFFYKSFIEIALTLDEADTLYQIQKGRL